MGIFNQLSAFACMLALVSATAVPRSDLDVASPAEMSKQTVERNGFIASEHVWWNGEIKTFMWVGEPADCFNIPPEWDNKISAIMNVGNSYWCRYYADSNCAGGGFLLNKFIDVPDLRYHFNLQDNISSVRCVNRNEDFNLISMR
ncbi:hypothetical protein BJ508DRAFT_33001 [Ascobolus immersus RN42]|uniref:Beta/gamma crystallin 'Greek key' domain-containing protein n=1 Tax=Ascobolus immersus RN42 TaxID=1160509 RepID=A0A3N4IET4_ASCIM|nr:hypothetical protein BJ508DRAFT_33001 [Ascobolus immersus RN42]